MDSTNVPAEQNYYSVTTEHGSLSFVKGALVPEGATVYESEQAWQAAINASRQLPHVDLSMTKAQLKRTVDAQAESERLKYITPGAGQSMTYQQKVDEARAFKATSSPKASDYPVLSSEVGITAETLSDVADIVLAAFAQWQLIGAAIEGIRLGAKRDIDAAADEAAARAIVDAIEWPQPAL